MRRTTLSHPGCLVAHRNLNECGCMCPMNATHCIPGAKMDRSSLWDTRIQLRCAMPVDRPSRCSAWLGRGRTSVEWPTSLNAKSPVIPGSPLLRRANELFHLLCTCLKSSVVEAITSELGEGIWLKTRSASSRAVARVASRPMARTRAAGRRTRPPLTHTARMRERSWDLDGRLIYPSS